MTSAQAQLEPVAVLGALPVLSGFAVLSGLSVLTSFTMLPGLTMTLAGLSMTLAGLSMRAPGMTVGGLKRNGGCQRQSAGDQAGANVASFHKIKGFLEIVPQFDAGRLTLP